MHDALVSEAVVASPSPPWRGRRLVTWWEMEKFSAAAVYEIARSFEQLRMTCGLWERFGMVHLKDGKLESMELLPTITPMNLDENWRESVISILKSVQLHCQSIGLNLAVQAAKDYREAIEAKRINTHGQVVQAIATLDKVITLQLKANLFMFIASDRADSYANPQLFGDGVSKKFPGCQYDIEEAGNCYVAGRSTACAFHLMRVMETGVQEFGTVLGITRTNEKNWQNILDEINAKIKALPPKDVRAIALSQAAGCLYNVKVAWRNPTMHPKITYTLEEAADLISNVKGFMRELAQVI